MNDYDRNAGSGGRWRTPYTTTEVNEDTPGSEPRQPVSSCSYWRSGLILGGMGNNPADPPDI